MLALAQAPPLTKAEQLQDAARKGDAATVKKLLDEGVDVNTKFRYNATALFYACDHGHLEVVKVLLDRGADMSVKDTFYGFTPLVLATGPAQKKKPEHTEIAKLLIQQGSPGKEHGAQRRDPVRRRGAGEGHPRQRRLPAPALTDALETAKAANKTEMVTLLEQARRQAVRGLQDRSGAAREIRRHLQGRGRQRADGRAAGARITVGQPAAPAGQRLTLVATGDKAFKAIGAPDHGRLPGGG